LPEELAAYSDSKSAVSARFACATGKLLPQFLHRPIERWTLVKYVDAIFLGWPAILVALGVDETGHQPVLGIREGSTENTAVTVALLEDLAERDLYARQELLFVVGGSQGIPPCPAAVRPGLTGPPP
jgi:transposase-like protein